MLEVIKKLRSQDLHTVCEEAHCPNLVECFSKKTATFLIMGKACTRNCRFCAVESGEPEAIEGEEPANIAKIANELDLKYVVITSVTRDDLSDGGATHFCNVVSRLKEILNPPMVEVLVPDFKGDENCAFKIVLAGVDVFAHNLETVPRLYKVVRPQADFKRSLALLWAVKEKFPHIITKTGIMVGLGEKEEELMELFLKVNEVCCDILTIGQYLAPSQYHYPVNRFYSPEEFEELKSMALEAGIKVVYSGPFIRSSFNAYEVAKTLVC
jgi:lipoic acid synthetase